MEVYRKLSLMTLLSLIIMYGVMFLNVDTVDDIFFSLTRLYMALLMVAPMTVIMLLIMRNMYPDPKMNWILIIASTVIFAGALCCLRTQAFISDTQYMKAMIPHHSSAVMTSKNAGLNASAVQSLADSIINSQEREIKLMKRLLDTE